MPPKVTESCINNKTPILQPMYWRQAENAHDAAILDFMMATAASQTATTTRVSRQIR
jgi:hypothetical protein